jgi:hypothetical protein
LKLTFFGGTDVFLAMVEEGLKVPYHLAMDLMGKGITTVMTLGDKEFIFNE